ncbi:MAG: thiol:disulfide interchange protein DsbA/DsbL [Tahibacter sp.]
MFKRIFVILACLLAVSACNADDTPPPAATNWTAGTHYFPIDPPQPTSTGDKIELVEVFSYACPHCAHFQPYIDELKTKLPKQVQFVYMPAVFNQSWEPFARAFYTAEALGVLEKTHQALFDALHRDKKPLRTIEELAEFYAGYGVDPKLFLSTAQSFVVEGKLARSNDLVKKYGVQGTPTLILNGKYQFSATSAGGFPQTTELVKYLVTKELAAKKGGK